jgi:hypothetical protein
MRDVEPAAIFILPFRYFDRNRDKIKAATLDGELPTHQSIDSGAIR